MVDGVPPAAVVDGIEGADGVGGLVEDVKAANMLRFAEEVGRLKHISRQGWLLRHIPDPERVTVS